MVLTKDKDGKDVLDCPKTAEAMNAVLFADNVGVSITEVEYIMALLLAEVTSNIGVMEPDKEEVPSLKSADKLLYIMEGNTNSLTRIMSYYAMVLTEAEKARQLEAMKDSAKAEKDEKH